MKDKSKTKKQLKNKLAKMRRQDSKLEALEKGYSQTEKVYEHFFNISNDMICIVGLDGYFKLVNPAFERVLGYTKEELYAKPFIEFVYPDDRNQNISELQEIREGMQLEYCENRYTCKDNSYRWIGWVTYTDADKGLMYAVGRDITQQKRTEEALCKTRDELEIRVKERTAELEKANKELMAEIDERKKVVRALKDNESRFKRLSQEFDTVLNAIPDNLVLLSPDMKIMWANKAANKAASSMFGKNDFELTGQSCFDLCCNIMKLDENYPSLKSFRTGQEETVEISTSDGRVWDIRAFPLKDESGGRIKNVIELARDITAKVRMEDEAKIIQAKLIHANKMTSLGTLVSGVAHEINNPNTFIKSNARLLSGIWKNVDCILEKYRQKNGDFLLGRRYYSDVRELLPKLLEGIDEGSMRIQSIVDNLRDFARPDKAGLDGKVDINKVIMTSSSILNNQIKKCTANFQINCNKNLPLVKGSSQQIEQVVINLIMNSLQALKNKDCGICVSTSHNKKVNSVVIKVRDEGLGMTKDTLERIIEPFFTTKLDSGGTGLGLSISYVIIKEHNGTLEFESKPGRGTTATIKLPVYYKK